MNTKVLDGRYKKTGILLLCLPASLFSALMWGQAADSQLEVISSNIDSETHVVSINVLNHGTKNIAAFVLDVQQFDAAENKVGAPLRIGYDGEFYLSYGEDSEQRQRALVAPNAETTKTVRAEPGAAKAEAKVLLVVYSDRTSEGDRQEAAMLFKNRAMHAQRASQALQLMTDYPVSPSERDARLKQIKALPQLHPSVTSLDPKTVTQGQWKDAALQQKALVDFLTTQSQGVVQP